MAKTLVLSLNVMENTRSANFPHLDFYYAYFLFDRNEDKKDHKKHKDHKDHKDHKELHKRHGEDECVLILR